MRGRGAEPRYTTTGRAGGGGDHDQARPYALRLGRPRSPRCSCGVGGPELIAIAVVHWVRAAVARAAKRECRKSNERCDEPGVGEQTDGRPTVERLNRDGETRQHEHGIAQNWEHRRRLSAPGED